jgi:CHAP domain
MKTSTKQRIAEVREILNRRYPNYASLSTGERVLLAMSVLANDIKVRENGANSGPWVEAILDCSGLGAGYPWCAAAINFACEIAGSDIGPTQGVAAVRIWHTWAKGANRIMKVPSRGYLALWLNDNGTGHIGIVAGVTPGRVTSYEGNTSSGEAGSQRDGDGLYRRNRAAEKWEAFIDLS